MEPKDVRPQLDGSKPANGQMGQGNKCQPNMGGQGGNGLVAMDAIGAQAGGNGDMNGGGTTKWYSSSAPNLSGEGGQPSGPCQRAKA